MDAAFLVAYLVLAALALGRARSLAWMVVTTAGVTALVGVAVNALIDRGHAFTSLELQWLLLVALLVVAVLAWVPALGFDRRAPGTDLSGPESSARRQLLAIALPVIAILGLLLIITVVWTDEPAFLRPVSFLIGNGEAEDNAKWLDFTAQWASGEPIEQAVPMGGPLQLLMTFVATAMGVGSQVALGGVNEVAVAANAVVYGEFFMVALVVLALTPMVEARFRTGGLPVPLLWLGSGVLAMATLAVINFGHLSLQFTFLVMGLWSATFLSALRMRRSRLLTSLAAAAAMTVWLPLNVAALVICLGWLAVLVSRAVRGGRRQLDAVGLGLVLLMSVGLFEPIRSSLVYGLGISSASEPAGFGGAVRGVVASVRSALSESPLFGAGGGTEQTTAVLAILALAAVIAAGVYLTPIAGPLASSLVRCFIPLIILGITAIGIYTLDFWVTGDGPHYGSLKFTFMVVITGLATAGPLGLALLNSEAGARMTTARWLAVGAAIVVFMVDSLLPRALAQARPQQWSPPIPFNNTSGSYWWPADVNGTAIQPIRDNPVACVYLPPGALVPSAIVPSGLSDPQRVYNCTRQLAGLAGEDSTAQPIVEWLRREWLTNTPAWSPVYDSLAGMPDSVLDRPVILLDEGSNVTGLETMRSLLERFPRDAGQQ